MTAQAGARTLILVAPLTDFSKELDMVPAGGKLDDGDGRGGRKQRARARRPRDGRRRQ